MLKFSNIFKRRRRLSIPVKIEIQKYIEYDYKSYDCENLDWDYISMNIDLFDLKLIKTLKNHLNWKIISSRQDLSKDFIKKFKKDIDWFYLCMYYVMNEEMIEEYIKYIDWCQISKYQILSYDFVKKYNKKLNMIFVYSYQTF